MQVNTNVESNGNSYKYFLSVGAIFKNESHILVEWIEHYLSQGVEHFYLIDNGSTDNYMDKIIRYIKFDIVTLFKDDTPNEQIPHYNKYILPHINETEWLFMADLDEFAYAPNHNKLTDVLQDKKYTNIKNLAEISCPWIMFGSNGHISQPASVVKNFVKRWNCNNIDTIRLPKGHVGVKSFVKTNKLNKIHIHRHNISGISVCSNLEPFMFDSSCGDYYVSTEISEKKLASYDIVINHYIIQSAEYYCTIKMTRGDVNRSVWDNLRDVAYFNDNDKNDIEDMRLVLKKLRALFKKQTT